MDKIFTDKIKVLTFFWSIIIGLLIGIALTLISGKVPISISKILIVQKSNLDIYSLVKSAEIVAEIVKEVSSSQRFIKEVYNSPFDLKEDLPEDDPKTRLSFWKNRVKISTSSLTGSISFETKGPNAAEALKLNSAILYTINQGIKKFYGNPESFELVIIDPPYLILKYKGLGLIGNSLISIIIFLAFSYLMITKKS